MSIKHAIFALCLVGAVPTAALAQGTLNGAADGADRGAAAAGPVGAVVGGAVGAATGTVGGVLGVPAGAPPCETRTVQRENGYGDTDTRTRTNCP